MKKLISLILLLFVTCSFASVTTSIASGTGTEWWDVHNWKSATHAFPCDHWPKIEGAVPEWVVYYATPQWYGPYLFRHKLYIPEGIRILSATLQTQADNSYIAYIDGQEVARNVGNEPERGVSLTDTVDGRQGDAEHAWGVVTTTDVLSFVNRPTEFVCQPEGYWVEFNMLASNSTSYWLRNPNGTYRQIICHTDWLGNPACIQFKLDVEYDLGGVVYPEIKIEPERVNYWDLGQWIIAWFDLPPYVQVDEAEFFANLKLMGQVAADPVKSKLNYNVNGRYSVMAFFSEDLAKPWLFPTDPPDAKLIRDFEIWLTGMYDDQLIVGSDLIDLDYTQGHTGAW